MDVLISSLFRVIGGYLISAYSHSVFMKSMRLSSDFSKSIGCYSVVSSTIFASICPASFGSSVLLNKAPIRILMQFKNILVAKPNESNTDALASIVIRLWFEWSRERNLKSFWSLSNLLDVASSCPLHYSVVQGTLTKLKMHPINWEEHDYNEFWTFVKYKGGIFDSILGNIWLYLIYNSYPKTHPFLVFYEV